MILLLMLPGTGTANHCSVIELKNNHIRVSMKKEGGAWKLASISRSSGDDTLHLENQAFEAVDFEGRRFTVDDYITAQNIRIKREKKHQILRIPYQRKPETDVHAPEHVDVIYVLGAGPYLRKTVRLSMKKGGKMDRLAVLHFSGDKKARLGGRGQPIYMGNWWFGMDYPCFYGRHSDGYREPDFHYRWDYMIDLEGRDKLVDPRPHTVSVFHFPGFAEKAPDHQWRITSKRAVMGISATPGEPPELGLLDYITETRKPTRSYLHFNNWYSGVARKVSKETFVDTVFVPMQRQFKKYGANLDGMCADHGWEVTGKRCFEAKNPTALVEIQRILKERGSGLGLWIALDGTNQKGYQRGIDELGYQPAYAKWFDRSRFKWMGGNKKYWNLLQPKYYNDLKRSLEFMISQAKIDYLKHDFNHNFTSDYISQRHAREKCLDATLALLEYERRLNPDIFINYTNGAWFSPFWLQFVDCLWMMSGDSGGNNDWPQISLREGATTYRCKHFHRNFNSRACPRPAIPIANFMTHGILLSHRKPFTDFKDSLHEWSNYVVMYMARGTTLKELYLDTDLLDDDHWKVLAKAARWATENQEGLMNTVMIGGNPSKGEIYGYISWVDGKAILAARNPDRGPKTLNVPFDQRVYFRGNPGMPYKARCIYPFKEEMPWPLTSNEDFPVTLPGDSVMIFQVETGKPKKAERIKAKPLPPHKGLVNGSAFHIELEMPDEAFKRCDLLLQSWNSVEPEITINGRPVTHHRFSQGKRWSLALFDLKKYRGKNISIKGRLLPLPGAKVTRNRVEMEAWLTVDRKVMAPLADDPGLPFLVSQQYRRITEALIKKRPVQISSRNP